MTSTELSPAQRNPFGDFIVAGHDGTSSTVTIDATALASLPHTVTVFADPNIQSIAVTTEIDGVGHVVNLTPADVEKLIVVLRDAARFTTAPAGI